MVCARVEMRRFLFSMLVITCPLSVSCEVIERSSDIVLDTAAEMMPHQVTESLDSQAWEAIRSSQRVIDDAVIQEMLVRLTQPLVETVQTDEQVPLKWRFWVLDSSDVNAFALPGGTVGIHSGLIAASETGLEFFGVVAHEVAHVTERHGLKSMMVHSSASLVLSLIFGDFFGLSGLALNSAAQLGLLKFSRDQEREADRVGAQLLSAARYPSLGLESFFIQLARHRDQGGAQSPALLQSALSLLATHPMSEERARSLAALVAQNPYRELPLQASENYATLRARVMELSKSD